MTILQWAELAILIILFWCLYRDPAKRELDIYLPDCVEYLPLYLRTIPLCVCMFVYSLWYGFKNIPFFWGVFVSEWQSLSDFLYGLFSLIAIIFSAGVICASVATLLERLSHSKKIFSEAYKGTRELLENGFFNSAYLRRLYRNADVKYISLKTFLKIKDVIPFYIDSETCAFFYKRHNNKKIFLSCSPITYLVILLSVVKQKEKEQKEKDKLDSKKKKKKKVLDDSELLKIFIEDLQKRKEENERKANQYFNQAKETFEQVKNNS